MKLTRPTVAALRLPQTGEAFHWDDTLPGFGVRLRSTGARRFVVQYRDGNGATRRLVLGDTAMVTLDEARGRARELLARVKLGADPQAEKVAARQAKPVLDLVNAYLGDAAKRMKPRSLIETTRHLRMHAKPLHHRAIVSVSRAEIADLLAGVEHARGAVAANRVRSSLSAMWGWAMMEGYPTGNPVAATRKREEATRERTLSDAELALIWACSGSGTDHDRIVRLLMLTGLRRDEVGRLGWAEVADTMLVIPGNRTKNGLPHEVPLHAMALAQFPPRPTPEPDGTVRTAIFGKRADQGYSGWSRSKDRLDGRLRDMLVEAFVRAHGRHPGKDEVPPAPWTLHDLRRTVATWLSEHGEEPHVVEALLNHVSGKAKAGVAGIYNRASYREQKRAALAKWAGHVAEITRQALNNVEALNAGR
jgi:integrase